MTITHTVILEEIGGGDVITCPAVGIKHIEHTGSITPESIKSTMLYHLHLKDGQSGSDFVVEIADNRPASEDYNAKRDKEAREFKPKRPFMY